jgi:hypothetical protein
MSTPQAGDPAFFAELAPDAVLHASILAAPVAGAEAVRGAIRRIAGFYSGMTVDFRGAAGARQLLQYHAGIGDDPISIHAMVVMSRDAAGAIAAIEIGYYPLAAARLLANLYQEPR